MDEATSVDSVISKKDNSEEQHHKINNSGSDPDANKFKSNHEIVQQVEEEEHVVVTNTKSESPYSSTTIYISGIPIRYCTESVIEKIMSPYGKIIRCTVHTQQQPKVYAFCDYENPTSASAAIRAVNGRKLGGQALIVRPAFKEQQSIQYHHGTTTTKTSSSSARMVDNSNSHIDGINNNNPKRQRQQIDSKIDAIKRKLAKHSS